MNVPENLRYTREHEWFDPETGRVGITDHAQDALGDVVFVDPPAVGRKVVAGEPVAVVESVKSVSDVYAPVGGEVAEVHQELSDHPEWINQDPYGKGWIFRLENTSEPPDLLTSAAYREMIEGS